MDKFLVQESFYRHCVQHPAASSPKHFLLTQHSTTGRQFAVHTVQCNIPLALHLCSTMTVTRWTCFILESSRSIASQSLRTKVLSVRCLTKRHIDCDVRFPCETQGILHFSSENCSNFNTMLGVSWSASPSQTFCLHTLHEGRCILRGTYGKCVRCARLRITHMAQEGLFNESHRPRD